MKHKFFASFLSAVALCLSSALFSADYTVKLSSISPESHGSYIALTEVFKKGVEAKSKGKIVVEVYPNGQLGSDRQSIEGLGIGTIEMASVGGGSLLTLDDRLSIMDLPFLFKDSDLAFKAYNEFLTTELNKILKPKNVRILFATELGFRHITNSRNPIVKPDDLNGIKLRTMENPLHIEVFKLLGAKPTPVAFPELYTALQQGTVDGQENPIAVIATGKFNEVQKYLSLTGHVYTTSQLLMSDSFFNDLPKDLQKIILDTAEETKVFAQKLLVKQNQEMLETMKAKGLKVNVLTDAEKQVFLDKLKPIYTKYIGKHGDTLIKRIQAVN